MRRFLSLLIVLFMMSWGIGTAFAFNYQTGPFGMKYTGVAFTDFDYPNLYAGKLGISLHPAQDPNNISGNVWGISSLTNAFTLLDNNPENNSLSGTAFYNAGSDGKRYFAVWGGLTYLSDTGASTTNRQLRLKAGPDGAYLKVYEVSAADFGVYDAAYLAGPNVPGKGAFGTFGTQIINAPSATLWLDAIFSPGTMMYYDAAYQTNEVELLTQSSSVTGSTEAYLKIIGGIAAPYFKIGVFPLGFPFAPNRADLKIISDSTLKINNLGKWTSSWTTDIQDPITGEFITPVPHLSCEKYCDNVNSTIDISAKVINDGGEPLSNVNCSDDPPTTLNGVPVASLARGDFITVTGSYSPAANPSKDTITCTATGALTGTEVTATCSATCGQNLGQCRMTGGSETPVSYYTLGTDFYWTRNTFTSANGPGVLVTTGGQIGAPLASAIGPSFGEWEHHQICTGKKGACTGNAFAFDFKAGTASGKAKDTTTIDTVVCGDPGWCTQSRCAPFKQIFWDGIGLIKNITPTFQLPVGVTCENTGNNSLHYFKAHVGDFGEPGSTAVKEKSCKTCPWKSGGVEIGNIQLLSPVYPAPPPFGDKGGQTCPCGCGDWYEIEIHCTKDPASAVIYRFQSFINTGNFQLHPPVGESCN